MKESKYFKKKEIDLTKVSIFLLTDEGKSKLKNYIKKSIKILLLLTSVLFVVFIIWGMHEAKLNKKKKVCDDLVSSFIWEKKEALRLKEVAKQKAFNKKHGLLHVERRGYLDWSPHTVLPKDKVLARRAIPECNDVYADGLEKR